MKITETIRNASSEHIVYFLLTAYAQSLQTSVTIPKDIAALPLCGLEDVWSRFDKLVAEFQKVARLSDRPSFVLVAEALNVFDTALNRLSELFGDGVDRHEIEDRSLDPPMLPEMQAA